MGFTGQSNLFSFVSFHLTCDVYSFFDSASDKNCRFNGDLWMDWENIELRRAKKKYIQRTYVHIYIYEFR